MKIRYVSAIATALALAACQSPMNTSTNMSVSQPQSQSSMTQTTQQSMPTTSQMAQTTNAMTQQALPAQKFECKKGMNVTVKHLGNDTISVAVDTIGAEVKLTRAVSGSGERYVNDKGFYNKSTEWHQKGNEGHLAFKDPYGNEVESACATK